MKNLILFSALLLLPLSAKAAFLFDYAVNYSSEKDGSKTGEYDKSRLFHKILLGASVNQKRTLYFGWNINSWSSKLKAGEDTANETSYSVLEMGPRFHWFMNDNYNWYLTGEWNPYAKGDRDKGGENKEISGSSMGFGLGYRFRLSRLVGLGASINYHSYSIAEEKEETTETDVSDKVTHLMPMLVLSIITK